MISTKESDYTHAKVADELASVDRTAGSSSQQNQMFGNEYDDFYDDNISFEEPIECEGLYYFFI